MRLLFATDRLSSKGGADLHLRQVMSWAVARGWHVTLACGRFDGGATAPSGIVTVRERGLATAVASTARLGGLDGLLATADVVHVQNIMNPVAVQRAVATGRAVVTVQDHRVFCPGPGKTLPDGSRCREVMSEEACRRCLADDDYRGRTLELTAARRDALRGARVTALSHYMARELAAVGIGATEVIPPWFELAGARSDPGDGVLLAGRLVAHKGVRVGWQAWRRAAVAMPLRVAGEGPLEAELEGAERLGWLSPEAFRRELRRARMLLFPGRWQEPFGMVGLEALAAGTPVVVAAGGGTDEWAGAGCLRTPVGDVAAMAAAIRQLADDPGLALRLGEQGRQMVAQRFDRGRLSASLERLYRDAAGGRSVEGIADLSRTGGSGPNS